MTPFQTEATDALRVLLARYGLHPAFASHQCRQDDLLGSDGADVYRVATAHVANHVLELYIYPDEAGYFADRVWCPFERQDYASSGALVNALTSSVTERLDAWQR